MSQSKLVGYVRKTKAGGGISLSIDRDAFIVADSTESKDGRAFVRLVCNAAKVQEILSGSREVTSITHFSDE